MGGVRYVPEKVTCVRSWPGTSKLITIGNRFILSTALPLPLGHIVYERFCSSQVFGRDAKQTASRDVVGQVAHRRLPWLVTDGHMSQTYL